MSWKLVGDRRIRLPYRAAKLRRNSWGRRLSFVTIPHIQVTWYVNVIFQQIWLNLSRMQDLHKCFFAVFNFKWANFRWQEILPRWIHHSIPWVSLRRKYRCDSSRNSSRIESEKFGKRKVCQSPGEIHSQVLSDQLQRVLIDFYFHSYWNFISEVKTFHKINTYSSCALDERYRNHFMK